MQKRNPVEELNDQNDIKFDNDVTASNSWLLTIIPSILTDNLCAFGTFIYYCCTRE